MFDIASIKHGMRINRIKKVCGDIKKIMYFIDELLSVIITHLFNLKFLLDVNTLKPNIRITCEQENKLLPIF